MKSHLNLQRIYIFSSPHSPNLHLPYFSSSYDISEIANSVSRLHSTRSQIYRIIHVDQMNVWCCCECIDKNVLQSNYPLHEGNRHVNGRWNEWKIMSFYMTLISFGWFDFQFFSLTLSVYTRQNAKWNDTNVDDGIRNPLNFSCEQWAFGLIRRKFFPLFFCPISLFVCLSLPLSLEIYYLQAKMMDFLCAFSRQMQFEW